jgi:hypothetical protein
MNYRIAMLALAAAPAFAQLQLSALDGLSAKAKESVEITLDAATLKLVGPGMFGRGSDTAALSEMLSKLKGITVRSYEFSGAGQYDQTALQPLRDQLKAQGWTRPIEMKEGQRESFELFIRADAQGNIAGFAMIAAEPNELAVIHIDGPINMEDLARLGGRMGIPRLPSSIVPSQPFGPVRPVQKAPAKAKTKEKAEEIRIKEAQKSTEASVKALEKAIEARARAEVQAAEARAKALEQAAEARARAERARERE